MDELVHQPVVARDDHHQVVPVVLHGLQQRVDGLLAEVVGPAAVEGVCLVDEQHTPQSGVDDLPGLDGCLSHVARHQPAAVHLRQLPLGQDAQAVVDPGHQPGDGGLSRAGIAGKHHVETHVRCGQAVLPAQTLYRRQIDEVFHLPLHRTEAHIAVQLLLQILDVLFGGSFGGVFLFLFCRLWRLFLPAVCRRGPFFFLRQRNRRHMLLRCRSAPEVRAHAAEVVLRHRADHLQLPQDDLVLFALIPLVHPLTPPTVLYVPAPGTGRRRSAPSMPR